MPAADDDYEFFAPTADDETFQETHEVEFETNEGEKLTSEDIVEIVDELKEEVQQAEADEAEAEEAEARLVAAEDDYVPALVNDDSILPKEVVEKLHDKLEEVNSKPVYSTGLIRELRKFDRKGKTRTCAGCAKRKPFEEMENGKAEFCPECK